MVPSSHHARPSCGAHFKPTPYSSVIFAALENDLKVKQLVRKCQKEVTLLKNAQINNIKSSHNITQQGENTVDGILDTLLEDIKTLLHCHILVHLCL